MTKKEKEFLYSLLNRGDLLQILDMDYSNNDKECFYMNYGLNFNEAIIALGKLLKTLK